MSGRRLEVKSPAPKKKKRLVWTGLIVSVLVMAGSAFYLGKYYWHIFAQGRAESRIGEIFDSVRDNFPSPDVLPSEDGAAPAGPSGPEQLTVSEWQKERDYKLALEAQGREVYKDILEINPDWLGFVRIPGVKIDTFYVCPTDDDDYYLTHDFYGKTTPVGTVYLNFWNDRLLMDRNTVLYGHNIKGGAMFSPLLEYKKAGTFKKAPVVTLDGLLGESVWIVFAAYVTEPDWGYVETNPAREAFGDMLDEIKARSWFTTDVDVNEDDRILTLSTCDYSSGYEDMRFAVHARLLRPGEEIPEEVTAVENTDKKPFNSPARIKLSEITPNLTAVMQHPNSYKLYFYQPREGGVDWFSGNTSEVQGPYSGYTGRVSKNSFIAAVYDPHPDKKMVYIAADNFNRQTGIYLLTNRLPSGDLISRGLVTPPGVNAKYPALVYEDETVWLLYTVAGDGGEEIYRRRLSDGKAAGEPELLVTAPAGSGARALGCYTVNGARIVFWHEAAGKKTRGVWEGGDAFDLPLSGDYARVTFYGFVTGGKIKALTEKNGRLSFVTVDINALPGPPALPAVNPDPEPDPEPGPEDAPDGEPDDVIGGEDDPGGGEEIEPESQAELKR